MKRLYKSSLIILPIIVILLFSSVILQISNFASLDIKGFDVDSEGRVYIGRLHKVEIYENKQLVHAISVPKARFWSFYLFDDNNICFVSQSTICEIDNNGEILLTSNITTSKLCTELYKRREITGKNSVTYKLLSPNGITRIVNSQGEVVYSSPFIDIYLRFALYFSIAGMFFVIPSAKKHLVAQLNELDGNTTEQE